jgi:hypothetical protein
MRRLITILASLTVISLLAPSTGLAQIDPPADYGTATLCIFTAEDLAIANNSIFPPVAPFVQHRLYFVLYNPQIVSDFLGAMTFSWRMEPTPSPAPVVILTLPAGTINLGNNYNVILGFGNGVNTVWPGEPNHGLVATVDVMFLSALAAPTSVYLGPADPTSIPGYMEYNDFSNPGIVLPAVPYSVSSLYQNPVFVFGGNGPVATESETWGGVKSLFR